MSNLQEIISEHFVACEMVKTQLKMGPWMHEPHRVEFLHKGLNCLLVRRLPLFFWCGYVGVPKDNYYHGKQYEDVAVEIHGGLTYSNKCQELVCHQSESDEDNIHWLGFDCAHFWDLVPYMPSSGTSYKDIEFVMNEVKSLAEQLAKAP